MAMILLVEDDAHLRYGLVFNLEQEGHLVTAVADGESALQSWSDARPDLVVLDVMLPGISGLEVLEARRKAGDETPVLMLTARAEETDAVTALAMGADDYVRKPFGISELLARIEAILKRAAARVRGQVRALHLGPWSLDLADLRARGPGGDVPLTSTEVELLQVLLERDGAVCRREDLLERVWGVGARVPTRTLDNHVARLRKKLEADPAAPRLLITVHGVGYRLDRSR
jgi:DNA-binding response OmpR family regulator